MRHNSLTLRTCKEVAPKTYNASGRNVKIQMDSVSPMLHMEQIALSSGCKLNSLANHLLRNIYGKMLHRLAPYTINILVKNLRLPYGKLKALSSHCLDKYREMQHTPPVNHKGI